MPADGSRRRTDRVRGVSIAPSTSANHELAEEPITSRDGVFTAGRRRARREPPDSSIALRSLIDTLLAPDVVTGTVIGIPAIALEWTVKFHAFTAGNDEVMCPLVVATGGGLLEGVAFGRHPERFPGAEIVSSSDERIARIDRDPIASEPANAVIVEPFSGGSRGA